MTAPFAIGDYVTNPVVEETLVIGRRAAYVISTPAHLEGLSITLLDYQLAS